MENDYEQFSLLRFTSQENLSSIVTAFCNMADVSGGVVAMPKDPDQPPDDESAFQTYRLTHPEVVNQRAFCKIIRSCSAGNRKCMWSDLSEARKAVVEGHAIIYNCHLGLIDIVAPIKVAGHHVANVYLGEIRSQNVSFEQIWSAYKSLLKKSKVIRQQASKDQLQKAFESLPCFSESEAKYLSTMASVLGNLISERATRQAAVVIALDASREVGSTLNLQSNLSVYLRHAMRLLNGDSGSIFLFNEDRDHLVSFANSFGKPGSYEIKIDIDGGGLVASCARENLRRYHGDLKKSFDKTPRNVSRSYFIRKNSRAEIDAFEKSAVPESHVNHNLQSTLVVPITNSTLDLLGVIDIGSSTPNAFTEDDQYVLRLFAREIGHLVGNLKDRRSLLDVFGKSNPAQLAKIAAFEIPRHVMGRICSVFLKEGDTVQLFASSEFPSGMRRKIFYRMGEGLTGWVFKTGRPLRIPAGPKCRTVNMPAELKNAGVIWKGKYRKVDSVSRAYWQNRPFLAVPVRDVKGAVSGVIRVPDRNSGSFTESDQGILQAFADSLGQLIRPELRPANKDSGHVFLGYGRDITAKVALQDFLTRCGLVVECYDNYFAPGKFVFETLMEVIENSQAAVILYTGDDTLKEKDVNVARRNVAYELGFSHATFGPQRTLLLVEEGAEVPSNVAGMQVLYFKRNALPGKFADIRDHLKRMRIVFSETETSNTKRDSIQNS